MTTTTEGDTTSSRTPGTSGTPATPGAPPSFDDLVRRNLDWARDFVRRRLQRKLRGDADSIDFVQEAILAIVRGGPPELRDDEAFRALLSRVLQNDLRDRVRFVHRDRRDVDRVQGQLSDTVLRIDPPAKSATSPSVSADRAEREAWIRLAMELLPAEDREVLRMREWDELTFEAIGVKLGIAADAARMRYQRALPRLARKVEALRLGGGRG